MIGKNNDRTIMKYSVKVHNL